MSKKTAPAGRFRKKHALVLVRRPGPFLAVAAILALLRTAQAAPGATEELALPRAPYGSAFDGTNFWTTDIQERRLIRLAPGGRSTSTFLGRGRIYGVDFNPTDGHLYVGAERRLLRVNPVTAGKTDTIAVPVKRVAGVAFSGVLWYLLEKGTGNIHVYEPALQRTIRTIATGRTELRDIALRGPNIWTTDGSSGVIYRYRILDGVLTGSLRAPSLALRGLCFREGQLWIVDRNRRALVRLPYVESEYSIVSGERRYEVTVSVRYTITPGLKGNLVLLLPHATQSQQPTAIRAQTSGWQRAYSRRGRPLLWTPARPAAGEQVVSYSYRVTAQNARWYIPDSFTGPAENLEESLAAGYSTASEEEFNAGNPFASLLRILPGGPDVARNAEAHEDTTGSVAGGRSVGARVASFLDRARSRKLPARWTTVARLADSGDLLGYRLQAEVYLRGPGWIPIAQPDSGNNRLFSQDAGEITLYSAPDGEVTGSGPLLLADGRVGSVTSFRALPAQLTATVVVRGR